MSRRTAPKANGTAALRGEAIRLSEQSNVLEVWLDCDLGPACLVSMLAYDRNA